MGSNPTLSATPQLSATEVNVFSEIIPLEMATFRFAADEGRLAGQEGVVMAYVVRHPEATVLFDTGIGFGSELVDDRYHPRARRLFDALAEVGVEPADISAVVNCHLHIDHAGQNSQLRGIPTYAQPAEWEAAHGEDYTILEWVDFQGADYRLRAGDYDLLAGMRVITTPGHTPGHQSLVVDTASGTAILAGQAVYSRDEWANVRTDREGASRAWDRAAYDSSIRRLRELDPARVHFGHDRAVWVKAPPRVGGSLQGV